MEAEIRNNKIVDAATSMCRIYLSCLLVSCHVCILDTGSCKKPYYQIFYTKAVVAWSTTGDGCTADITK